MSCPQSSFALKGSDNPSGKIMLFIKKLFRIYIIKNKNINLWASIAIMTQYPPLSHDL